MQEKEFPGNDFRTDKERELIQSIFDRIDLSDTEEILNYGASAQRRISDFSEIALQRVLVKDLGEVGEALALLTRELKELESPVASKKVLSFFKKMADPITQLRDRYSSVEVGVNRIIDLLEKHKVQLLKDIATLDELFASNAAYYKELGYYITAGRERLEKARTEELGALKAQFSEDASLLEAQQVRDFEERCLRFEKKLHDLDLTRSISVQMAPQIRLLQSSNSLMVEKIHSSIVNTLPLWKNSMVLALGVANTEKALQAQCAVSETTNRLLKKNAEQLQQSVVGSAREGERSIVEIQTIQEINKQLTDTLREVVSIQQEGRKKRAEAETELAKIEKELKQQLLDFCR